MYHLFLSLPALPLLERRSAACALSSVAREQREEGREEGAVACSGEAPGRSKRAKKKKIRKVGISRDCSHTHLLAWNPISGKQ